MKNALQFVQDVFTVLAFAALVLIVVSPIALLLWAWLLEPLSRVP